MIRRIAWLSAVLIVSLACTFAPAVTPRPINPPATATSLPSPPPRPNQPTVRIVTRTSDNAFHIVETGVPVDQLSPPTAGGIRPIGGASPTAIYVLNDHESVLALTPDGHVAHTLAFVLDGNGLAVWPGKPTYLSWGMTPGGPKPTAVLWMSNADGTMRDTPLVEEINSVPYQFVAQRWSQDGQAIYFSREPYGIGGYLPLLGASSWYRITVADRRVTEIVPFEINGPQALCLDDFSSDERLIAEHCGDQAITITDVNTRQTTKVLPPAGTVFKALGSTRFNAQATRVAFAMIKHDPTDEQGGLAVSTGLSGTAKLIATSQHGEYYTIAGWLNDDTLLVQLNQFQQCLPACPTSLWTLTSDGDQLTKLADGSFVAMLK